MKLLVVLLSVVAGILAATRKTGQNGVAASLAPRRQFIIGGDAIPVTQIPYIVSIRRFGAHRCGGTIISASRILSAAHCTISTLANAMQVRAGSTENASGGQLIQVASVVNHPNFNKFLLSNDISILDLQSNLILSPTVAIIGMPTQGAASVAGTMARVSGWGSIYEGVPGSPILYSVLVPIITNNECNALLGGGIYDGMICAGFPEGQRDACQGDSGGPLTAENLLIGIVSWSSGCARPSRPGVYTRVANYRNWIDQN